MVHARKTGRTGKERLRDLLKTPTGRNIVGAVLTQVPKGSGEDYGYYTQAYTYYSEESDKPGKGPEGGKPGPKGDSLNLN